MAISLSKYESHKSKNRTHVLLKKQFVFSYDPLLIFGEENGNPFQYSCLEISRGQRSLVGHSPRCLKESDTA